MRKREPKDPWRKWSLKRYQRKERGWLPVLDKRDGYVYPSHWLEERKTLIHKGRKP